MRAWATIGVGAGVVRIKCYKEDVQEQIVQLMFN